MNANAINLESNLPPDVLESRAADERRRLHNSVSELREHVQDRVHTVKDEYMDPHKLAQRYLWPASGVAAFFALLIGYGVTSIFSKPR